MLMLLRVSIGWHFLYAGIDKLSNPDFTSAGFLSQAKGPLAEKFYELVPDIDGRQRLDPAPLDDKDPKSIPKGAVRAQQTIDGYLDAFTRHFNLREEQKVQAEAVAKQAKAQVLKYFAENQEPFEEYFHDLSRLDQNKQTPDTPFQRKRNWDEQQRLRGKVKPWLKSLDEMAAEYRTNLAAVLTPEQVRAHGSSVPRTWKEFFSTDRVVTYTNLAIGVCLMVGLFTRLAAFGGAVFLLQIVLAQPDWPGLYPPPPPSAGRTLIVNKEFIEMMALLALATTRVGRWGGIDGVIHSFFRSEEP